MQNFYCENLSFYYGKKIVFKDVNLSFNKGDVVGLVGANGSGKTTLLKILAKINGRASNMGNYSVSFLIERPMFYPFLTGNQNLHYFEMLCEKILYKSEELLFLLNLQNVKDIKYNKYSCGMQMKLAIAKCLLKDADIYLFDEPLNGLDVNGVYLFRKVIKLLCEHEKIVVISSHILSELNYYCNKAIIIGDDHNCRCYNLKSPLGNQNFEKLLLGDIDD